LFSGKVTVELKSLYKHQQKKNTIRENGKEGQYNKKLKGLLAQQ